MSIRGRESLGREPTFSATWCPQMTHAAICRPSSTKTSANETKYQQALKTYVKGARFVMSKVGFVEDAKAAYVSCPLKSVVDLSKTKMDACVGASDSAVQPAPTATVAGSTDLGANQSLGSDGQISQSPTAPATLDRPPT